MLVEVAFTCDRFRCVARVKTAAECRGIVTATFHYADPTGSDQTKSADFVGDRVCAAARVSRKSPCGSARVRAVGPV